MSKAFASRADMADKTVSFTELAEGVYAYTAEGDPNTGVVIGDDAVLVFDAQATPAMARGVLERIRAVTDKPVRYVALSHYHAVRVLGASAYGAGEIVASEATRALVDERGQADYDSEVERFPRLFRSVETIPGLTWPTLTFARQMSVWLGGREVRLIHPGRGHTAGDAVAWLPAEKVLFAGDLVEAGATPYAGDAHLGDWPDTLARLAALDPEKLVPGRGPAQENAETAQAAIDGTRSFIQALSWTVTRVRRAGGSLKDAFDAARAALEPRFGHWVIFEHCLPFNVARAWDEAGGIDHPRVWTAARDRALWDTLQG